MRRKVPGLFVCPAGGIRHTRVSQKHGVPGSNPGWGTRFTAPAMRPEESGCSFTTRDVANQSRHSSTGRARRRRRRDAEFEPRCLLQRSRRLRVRIADLQSADAGSSPAGNTRGCNSTAESPPCKRTIWVRVPSSPPIHPRRAVAGARRSGRRERRFDSCRRDQHCPRSSADERDATNVEAEGSNPSGGCHFQTTL